MTLAFKSHASAVERPGGCKRVAHALRDFTRAAELQNAAHLPATAGFGPDVTSQDAELARRVPASKTYPKTYGMFCITG